MESATGLIAGDDKRPVHFVGIAGAGMNALAELLLHRGVAVTGCDLNTAGLENLHAHGAGILQGHDPAHVRDVRAVVVSSAVPRDHPELAEARALGLPVIRRAEALAEAVSGGRLVAVAGTHGKTTTTVMTATALAEAGLNPTGIAGGRVRDWGGNLLAGGDGVFVVEADEYDRSFLTLSPEVAVITNIEADHLDTYRDIEDIRNAFHLFSSRARVIVACGEDHGASTLPLEEKSRRVLYGIEGSPAKLDYVARGVRHIGSGVRFQVVKARGASVGDVELWVPGIHNVRNALAAICAGLELGGSFDDLSRGLRSFRGVERRFDILGTAAGITVVDDYAHHPTEIAATLDAARRVYPGRRLVCAFQPHLFTRTRDFASQFGTALALADAVLLTDIYAAREKPIEGVTSQLVEGALRRAGGVLAWHGLRADLVPALLSEARSGDVVLTLGAGNITSAARDLFADLEGRA